MGRARRWISRTLTLLPALAALPQGAGALAATLQISPVTISFTAGQAAAGITLQNNGDTPLHGQVRVYLWEQRDGADVLTPTTQLVASPPIMEIGARSAQTIRLVRRSAAPAAAEQTYRILIGELPRTDAAQGNVAIRLQYSVPVFVLPQDGRAAPALEWSVTRRGAEAFLRVRNSGSLHAQIGATSVRSASGRSADLSKGLLGYALPGQAREWPLPRELGEIDAPLAVQSTVNARPASASAGLGGAARD